MNKRIGLLGYRGQLGQVVMRYLQEKYYLRCGSRTVVNQIGSEKIEYVTVDVEKEEELKQFCKGCQVIINCVGPSYLVSRQVAKAALEAGADYVDVFGVNLFELKEELQSSNVVVAGAGSFPGLSGLLPAWLAGEDEHSIEKITLYAGGKEKITLNACIDVLLSMVQNFGKAGVYLSNQSLTHAREPITLPFGIFPECANAFLYLTKEMEAAAAASQIKELRWYNVQMNPSYEKIMQEAVMGLMQDRSKERVTNVAKNIMKKMEAASQEEELWYRIYAEAEYQEYSKSQTEIHILNIKDTYEVNGFLAASCAEAICKKDYAGGVYWPFEVLDTTQVMEQLISKQIISVTTAGDMRIGKEDMELEEGEI